MPTILQLRRGNTTQADAFTGAVGELTVDTTLNQLRLHDGSTAGGHTIGLSVSLVNDRMQVANAQALHTTATANLNSYIANTNPRLTTLTTSVNDRMQVANTTLLVGDRMQVSNTQALHTSITANLNSYIANTNPRITGLTSSVSDRMQVANSIAISNARLGATATVEVTGAVAGGPTAFSSNTVAIAVTQQNNSVTLGTHTTGNYVAGISGTANEVNVSGSGSETATVTIGLPDDVTVAGQLNVGENVIITGNLTVSGTTTYVDTTTLNIGDNIITLNADETGTPSQNGGIEVERGTSTNKTFIWDETNDYWSVGSETFVAGAVTATTFTGDLTGSASGVDANSVALGNDTTGNYVATVAAGGGISVSGSGSETAAVTVTHDDTSSQDSVNNSGRTYIQDITLDTYGHVTGLASATETVTDTNTTYTAGGDYGMTLSGTEFRLEDDRRRNSTSTDIYDGNTHDYIHYDADVGMRFYTAGAEEMRLENDGDLHVDGDITAFSSTVSDRNLKENIVEIDNALEKVSKINGYTFDYKHNGKSSAGVIAQEIEEVLPSAVNHKVLEMQTGDAETEYKVVEYDQVIGLLVSAIKELQAEIAELKDHTH